VTVTLTSDARIRNRPTRLCGISPMLTSGRKNTVRRMTELIADQLLDTCDPAELPFASTAEVESLKEIVGQPRALRALDFGMAMDAPGYNVFATGAPGTGRRSTVDRILRQAAKGQPTPDDLVYLFDFLSPEQPKALRLPPGHGESLKREMAAFASEARRRIAEAFQSEKYTERRHALAQEHDRHGEEALTPVREFAGERNTAVELTPAGIATIPMTHGHPLTPAQFQELPEERRHEIESQNEEVQARLPALIGRLAEIQREAQRHVQSLDREVAEFAIGHLVDDLVSRFGDSVELEEWLRQSHPADSGAPVVFETNPSHYNLFGRLDYEASFGAVSTDHRRIRPGAIHRANGGFLVLDVVQILTQPLVWEKLKETLRAGRIKIENFGAQLTLFPTTTVDPEPFVLDLKMVLIGSPQVYALLYELDEDVRKLFKVRADFDSEMPRTASEALQYAAFIARQVREQELLHFDRDAVARIIEHGSRLREHRGRLSARFSELSALVVEATHWARSAGRELVGPEDVGRAIDEKQYRSNLIEEKLRTAIAEGTLLIDVDGERIGQVNGLSVAGAGDLQLGRPSRITATVAVGTGELVNIDRETELSGPIHDKGFLILSGFLRERYGSNRPLSLSASLVFEQSYGLVEGDSASAAELFALLSSLAEAPVRQGIAVTGSVDQHGRIQAVGGVNEKIEGFFTTCRELGLNGDQGVVVPEANRRSLMLRREVVEAVREGRFHVWAIEDVDQGLELLTGLSAGVRRADGSFEEGTIHRKVEDRLESFATVSRRFRVAPEKKGSAEG
jgi:lon-related putative ATP-dependent protease